MTSGQFHLSETPLLKKSEVLELADRFSLDGEKLYRAYRKSNSLTPVQVEGMITYLKLIGRQLVSVLDHLIFMDKINFHNKIEAVKDHLDENLLTNYPYRKPHIAFIPVPEKFGTYFASSSASVTSTAHMPRLAVVRIIIESSSRFRG